MKKFVALWLIIISLTCLAVSTNSITGNADQTQYFPLGQPMPKTVLREYKYFQWPSTNIVKGKLRICIAEEPSCYVAVTASQKKKVNALSDFFKKKQFNEASDYYYKNFLAPIDNFFISTNAITYQLYVRPYKTGILVLVIEGQDGLSYGFRYITWDTKNNIVVYRNNLVTWDKNYAGFSLHADPQDEASPYYIFAQDRQFSPDRIEDLDKNQKKYGIAVIDGKLSYEIIRDSHKDAVEWFKNLDLNNFLSFTKKEHYWKEKWLVN